MELLVSGGGTGGHFFPALEVLREAKDRGLDTLYVGTQRGIESRYRNSIPGEVLLLKTYPFRGVSLMSRLKAVAGFGFGALKVAKRLGNTKVLLLGGYGSVPAGVASLLKRKPLYLHEQNSIPSSTNKLFSRFSKRVFITFEYSRRFFKGREVLRTGLPVRREVLEGRELMELAKEKWGFDKNLPVVLFMGGSQGAVFLNDLAVGFAKETGYQTLLLSGERDYRRVLSVAEGVKNLKVFPFREDMGRVYSAVDVAVCRSGAGTVSELSLFGIPALFIPYPYAVGDHQYYNAKEIEELGGAFVLRQESASLKGVVGSVERILENRESMSKGIGSFGVRNSAALILDKLFED